MNGPEHYDAAQRLIEQASETREAKLPGGTNTVVWTYPPLERQIMLQRAQVHATLAAAAATVEQTASRGPGDLDGAWHSVLPGYNAGG